MDLAQLKLIMDTLATMGAAGKEAFIWWLVLDKALPFIAIMTAVIGLATTIRFAILRNTDNFGETIRDTLGTGSDGYLSSDEKREVLNRIRQLLAAEKQLASMLAEVRDKSA